MPQKDFFTNSRLFNPSMQASKQRRSPVQNHQSKCSLTNKNWTSSATSTSTLSGVNTWTNHDVIGPGSYVIDSSANQGSKNNSRLMPRAKSSDTFEHNMIRPQMTPVDGNQGGGGGGGGSGMTSPTPTAPFVVSANARGTPTFSNGVNTDPIAAGGFNSLFAKLELLDKSMEGSDNLDEHVSNGRRHFEFEKHVKFFLKTKNCVPFKIDHQSAVIVPCVFRDAGCHFQVRNLTSKLN